MITKGIFELEQKWAELLKGPKRSKKSQASNKSITAAELQEQLQQDEEYQKWLKEKDEVGQMLDLAYEQDEKPLIDALIKAGLNVTSSWDLVNTKSSYKSAIPTLVEHLSKPYHIKNKEGIVRALAVKEAKGIACRAIIDEYHKAPKDNSNYRWTFGNTMAVIITDEDIEEIIEIVSNPENGTSRQMFVSALGKTKSERSEETLIGLLEDEQVKLHVIDALGKMKSERARSKIEEYAKNAKGVIKKEATKALKKINK